jgi:hypothetical protein
MKMWELVSNVIIVPVVVGVVRLLFAEEFKYFISLVVTFFWRPFDMDKNGKTHDWCMLHSSANGEWSKVSLLYNFNPFNGKSGVYVHRYTDKGKCKHIERIRFADWHNMRKAVIVSGEEVQC